MNNIEKNKELSNKILGIFEQQNLGKYTYDRALELVSNLIDEIKNSEYNKIIAIIKETDKLETKETGNKILKLTEELGELSEGYLKLTGYKYSTEDKSEILANIKGEIADLFIQVMVLPDEFNISDDELIAEIKVKLDKWKTKLVLKKIALEKENKVKIINSDDDIIKIVKPIFDIYGNSLKKLDLAYVNKYEINETCKIDFSCLSINNHFVDSWCHTYITQLKEVITEDWFKNRFGSKVNNNLILSVIKSHNNTFRIVFNIVTI
jgi:NTP pyrophosphatase (non-canonical NTP hydrolase)